MGEDNGLTLQALAQRLETLEHENAELRGEVAQLKGSHETRLLATEPPPPPPSSSESPNSAEEVRVSRRRLLSKAGVAAAGLVVAGALTQRDIREAKAAQVIGSLDAPGRGAVEGTNTNADGKGVFGYSPHIGVEGMSGGFGGIGVRGRSDTNKGIGVQGFSTSGHAISGEASDFAEVAGVRGTGKTGVWGSTIVSGYSGVYGQHTGSGFGVVGDGKGLTRAGVLGRNPTGYGGQFDGGQAQLKLNPKGTAGRPTSGAHTKGEIYLDSAGALFVCVASATPGTWRKVTTTGA